MRQNALPGAEIRLPFSQGLQSPSCSTSKDLALCLYPSHLQAPTAGVCPFPSIQALTVPFYAM